MSEELTLAEHQQESLAKALAPTSTDEKMPLAEIIENFEHLFKGKGAIQLEKLLMESFSPKEFEELGLSRFFPKMNRGLPRLYHRGHPSTSHIKKHFSHLPTLKALAFDKAVFSLYEEVKIERKFAISVFAWVINDNLGDFAAASEACRILKERFSQADLHLVVLADSQAVLPLFPGAEVHVVHYTTEIGPELFPQAILERFRSSELILQLPSYYPFTKELMEAVERVDSNLPMPKMELLGAYGFLESSWFHPKTGNRAMGLHFLEKGILVHKASIASFAEVENLALLTGLFGLEAPGPAEIEQYQQTHQFYLAYLATPIGGAVYLHALLKSLEHDPRTVDICTPDLDWFIQYIEMQNRQGKPILDRSLGVASIEVAWQGQSYAVRTGAEGKKLRLFSPGGISQKDFRTLVSLSGEFVGVRGDQSFSEAVSCNRVFFYDAREHVRYFMKDLAALAENRIAAHRSALACFRGMGKTLLAHLPLQEGEWVDESFFQEKEEWLEIAFQIGASLQDPDAVAGFKKLNRIIAEEYSCSEFLCHLVQRALCHRQNPLLAMEEAELISAFGSGAIPFSTLILELKGLLSPS